MIMKSYSGVCDEELRREPLETKFACAMSSTYVSTAHSVNTFVDDPVVDSLDKSQRHLLGVQARDQVLGRIRQHSKPFQLVEKVPLKKAIYRQRIISRASSTNPCGSGASPPTASRMPYMPFPRTCGEAVKGSAGGIAGRLCELAEQTCGPTQGSSAP